MTSRNPPEPSFIAPEVSQVVHPLEPQALEAGALGGGLGLVFNAIAAFESGAEGLGVADELAGLLRPCLPRSEQRHGALPSVRVAFAAFVEPS